MNEPSREAVKTDIIGGFPYTSPDCKGCGKPLTLENACLCDGCPCNSALGVNSMNETRWRLLMQLQREQSLQLSETQQLRQQLAASEAERDRLDKQIRTLLADADEEFRKVGPCPPLSEKEIDRVVNFVKSKEVEQLGENYKRLKAHLEQSEANAAAMREAVVMCREYIVTQIPVMTGDPPVFKACENALSGTAGREFLDERERLRNQLATTNEQLQTVHAHVKEAIELLGVDTTVENGRIPDSWTLREECHLAKQRLDKHEASAAAMRDFLLAGICPVCGGHSGVGHAEWCKVPRIAYDNTAGRDLPRRQGERT